MNRPYRVKRSEEHTIGRFTVVMDTLEIGGREQPYSFIRESDFVCVLPVFGDDIIYIRQYRHAVNAWKLEFPCGAIDPGETPEQAAARELLEETGCRAQKLTDLGWIHAKAGTSTARAHLYMARCEAVQEQSLEPAELIEVRRCSKDEFSALVQSGEFDHSIGLVAWYRGMGQI